MINIQDFFSNQKLRNAWVESEQYPSFKLYLRKGPRYINNKRYESVLDFANLESDGKQQLTDFFKLLKGLIASASAAQFDAIYVENILNFQLIKPYQALKFKMINKVNAHAPCMVLFLRGDYHESLRND